jgi:YHS domain-containing protein
VWAGDLDPICEMKVKPTTRDTAHYAGKVYGFCSESCKVTFLEDPAQYAQEAAAKH